MVLNFNNKDYNMILLNAIPYLQNCKRMVGSEGIAYVLNNDFIVKQYMVIGDWGQFDSVFDDFCQEMQSLSETTNFAKVYAWTKIPNMKYFIGKDKNKYNYYILEERVKGRDLYYGFLEDSYDLSKKLCSPADYYKAVKHPEDYFLLFKKIVELYIKDYIEINEYLEALSEEEIVKLMNDYIFVDENARFLESDVHPTNILIENNKLRPIDPIVAYNGRLNKEKDFILESFVNKLILLFWANEMCLDDSLSGYFKKDKALVSEKFRELQELNKKICKQSIIKFIKVLNKNFDKPKITNKKRFDESHLILSDIFEKDNAIVGEIENELNLFF